MAWTRAPRLVRGLDYYRHTAFEFVTDRLGAQGTVLGGGRYDGLIETLGGPHTPAVGWAAGIERLAMLVDERRRRSSSTSRSSPMSDDASVEAALRWLAAICAAAGFAAEHASQAAIAAASGIDKADARSGARCRWSSLGDDELAPATRRSRSLADGDASAGRRSSTRCVGSSRRLMHDASPPPASRRSQRASRELEARLASGDLDGRPSSSPLSATMPSSSRSPRPRARCARCAPSWPSLAAHGRADPEMRALARGGARRAPRASCPRPSTRSRSPCCRAMRPTTRPAMLEIRAGTGGDEAALFAADLFRMYERYAAEQGWQVELISRQRHRHRRLQGSRRQRRRHRRVRQAQVRERRPPRPARAGDRERRAHPHLGATVAVLPEAEEVDVADRRQAI